MERGGARVIGYVQRHFIELLAILPTALLLAGVFFTVGNDPYIQKRQKRTMLVLCAMVFSLVAQNYVDYLLTVGRPRVMLRRIVACYGYCARPAILLLFFHIVSPRRRHRWAWTLIGINAALYGISVFTGLCFTIHENNLFSDGLPVLRHTCMSVSLILLGALVLQTLRTFRPPQRKETWIPIYVALTILLALYLDANIGAVPQPVSFLTIAIVIGCALYYNWLHMQFVREHEEAIVAGQRVQLMLSQIKPHFLHNALTAIVDLCDIEPEKARAATLQFSKYLRGNMDAIEETGPIPFERELEHTRLYLEIEHLRFEDALRVRFDIACSNFSIPALTLEPLVENAVLHGVREKPDGRGMVTISTRETSDGFEISVTDDGPGFDPTRLPQDGKPHVGIANVRERLERVCGGTLEFRPGPGAGTTATILIPKG